ncbi:MAG: pesticidal protein Cry5Ba [Campylobacterales bacterium]|nr:pesticidal protein Cry5Ba [Campylobacterales bacterium]
MSPIWLLLLPLVAAAGVRYGTRPLGVIGVFWLLSSLIAMTLQEALIGIHASWLDWPIALADVGLLLFFAYVGRNEGDVRVFGLAIVQMLLFVLIELFGAHAEGATFLIDDASRMMLFIVNVVGGAIVYYAHAYMRFEQGDAKRFLIYLLLFIAVMNAIAMSNHLMHFFFFFELTTLFSYLLIRYRLDETAKANALRALWMNQIGGIALLIAALVASSSFDTLYLDALTQHAGGAAVMIAVFVALGAMIKGAAMPFQSWLLGAMVAPTPVSAILHSATMVKLAPFMVLKIAALLHVSFAGALISLFSMAVFVYASFLALSKTSLKEILGLSTIALLALMVSLAATGEERAREIVLMLILFHALSKALLFLVAGVLEKHFHLKDIEDMAGLIYQAPRSVALLVFGFLSLSVPPFGLLLGKLFALIFLAQMMQEQSWALALLLLAALGSTLLALLYFRLLSHLLSRSGERAAMAHETIGWGFGVPIAALSLLSVVLSLGYFYDAFGLGALLATLALLVVSALTLRSFAKVERVKEYACGERAPFVGALAYYTLSEAYTAKFIQGFGLFFGLIALAGVLS